MMGYRLLQFNLGTGHAQGYVLQGEGEHEGTNVSLSAWEVNEMAGQAQREAQMQYDYQPPVDSLIKGESRASPQALRRLAELLDRRFLLAHAENARRSQVRTGAVAE